MDWFRVPGSGFGVQVRGSGFGVRGSGFRFGVRGSGFRVRVPGSGSGFGGLVLGFGVCRLHSFVLKGIIPGVILAAGGSVRMGRAKALLPSGAAGETFVRRLALTLCSGGVEEALVVGRPDDALLRDEVEAVPCRALYVENANADAGGQLSSLLAGLLAADRPGVSAILVAPVDAPMIAVATVAALLEAFRSTGAPIARAVHNGRHGHPVIFSREVFEDLRRADPAHGARAVVRAHGARVIDVEVDDPGVLGDIDTPADYRAQFGHDL
jgi:molybdenum cofactor cytidylyltransferase